MRPSPRLRRISQVVAGIGGLNLVALWLVIATVPNWAPEQPRDSWIHPVVMRGGHTHYVPRSLGLYLDVGLWLHFALLAAGLGVAQLLSPRPTD